MNGLGGFGFGCLSGFYGGTALATGFFVEGLDRFVEVHGDGGAFFVEVIFFGKTLTDPVVGVEDDVQGVL